jgi:hypothetical protein
MMTIRVISDLLLELKLAFFIAMLFEIPPAQDESTCRYDYDDVQPGIRQRQENVTGRWNYPMSCWCDVTVVVQIG